MSSSSKPLLIVNADDLGWNAEATDRTIEAFAAGQITSSTALVHMEDSERAAALAREHELPTGLHLNLTDPFTDPGLPAAERDRHREVCRHFDGGGQLHLRSWTYDPRIQPEVEYTIQAQLSRYEEQFGAPPTHVDGHNHVHVCPNVARAKAIAGFKRRNALKGWPGTRTALGLARLARRLVTTPRAPTTEYFFDIAELGKRPQSLAERLELSRRTSVEVMAHPGFGHELEVLRSEGWSRAIEGLPRGSYADLS